MRTKNFQTGGTTIETCGIFRSAVIRAVRAGAKTFEQVMAKAKEFAGELGFDTLSIQMNLMDAVNEGAVIQRADGFSVF